VQAAILQQAAEYISFLIAERQHLLELNRQCIAATAARCLPPAPRTVKRRKGSDGEMSEDDGATTTLLAGHQLSCAAESRYKRRSSPAQNFDVTTQHARSLPIKKRKDEVRHLGSS